MKEVLILFSATLLIFTAEQSNAFGRDTFRSETIEFKEKGNNSDTKRASTNKLGIRIGTGYEMSETDGNDHEDFVQLSLGIFYAGKYVNADMYGITPHSGATLFSSIATINPITHFGIGGGYLYAHDNLAKDSKDTLNEEYYRGEYHAALFGINLAFYNLRASLYIGITLKGKILYQDKTNARYDYVIENYFDLLTAAALLSFEYRFNDIVSIMLSYHQIGGKGNIDNAASDDDTYMITRFITISFGYSLGF